MNMQAIPAPDAASVAPPTDLAGIRECAKLVEKSPSTISRQLKAKLFKNWGTEEAPRVSVAEVKAARKTRLDPAQQRDQAPASKPKEPETGYHADRAARESIRRQSEELDLNQRLGKILNKAEVEDDFETFARSLRERFRQRAAALILELDQQPTSTAKEARLVEGVELIFAELADELDSMADASGS